MKSPLLFTSGRCVVPEEKAFGLTSFRDAKEAIKDCSEIEATHLHSGRGLCRFHAHCADCCGKDLDTSRYS